MGRRNWVGFGTRRIAIAVQFAWSSSFIAGEEKKRGRVSPPSCFQCHLVSRPSIAAAATARRPIARSASLRFSIAAMFLSSRLGGPGFQAVLVAFQDFLPDGFLDAGNGIFQRQAILHFRLCAVDERTDYRSLDPLVELLHE